MDINKTQVTNNAEASVFYWLKSRGCKIVEREVGYWFKGVDSEKNGIADIAAIVSPTATEAGQFGLHTIHKRPKDLPKYQYLRNLQSTYFSNPPTVIHVEIKTQRGDFLKDKNKKFSCTYADLSYIAAPRSVLSDDEIPDGWFFLMLSPDCNRIVKIVGKSAKVSTITDANRCMWLSRIMHSVSNRYEYEALRKSQKEQRDRERPIRIRSAIIETIERAIWYKENNYERRDFVDYISLSRYFGQRKLSSYERELLEKFDSMLSNQS